MRKVYIEGDQVTKQKDGYKGFNGASLLTNIVLRCPNMTDYTGGFLNGTHVTNDVNEVISSAAQSFGQGAFSGTYLTGSLVLTNQTGNIGALSSLYVTNLYLEGPYAGNTLPATHSEQLFHGAGVFETVTLKWANVTNYADAGYNNFANLKELTLYMPKLREVRNNAFITASKLEKVTILGAALSTNCVDEMVKSFKGYASATDLPLEKGNRLYCSKKQGWAEMDACDSSYEGMKPEGCFGVYKTAAGEFKAWMIDLPQEDDVVFPEVATVEGLVAALKGAEDVRLAEKITTVEEYAPFHTWVGNVAGDDVTVRQAVKDSELAWFAYALDLEALPEKAPTNVVIETIGSAAEGGWDLVVKVEDVEVGDGASAADLGTVFVVEGAADLKDESFSADNVTTTFSATEDGKVKVEVEPKSAAGQFFIRVKMTP